MQSLLPPSLFLCVGFVCPHITTKKNYCLWAGFFYSKILDINPINVYSTIFTHSLTILLWEILCLAYTLLSYFFSICKFTYFRCFSLFSIRKYNRRWQFRTRRGATVYTSHRNVVHCRLQVGNILTFLLLAAINFF